MSWEVAEEESREGWDVTWVWREVFKGQDERKKIRLFIVVVVVTSLSLSPALLKVTWYLEEYNSSQEVYQRAKQYLYVSCG